jgi:serine/threonine protein kinase
MDLQDFKTQAIEKVFKDYKIHITHKVKENNRYICEFTCKGKYYILKGYSINIKHLDPINQKKGFEKALEKVGSIFKEYYFTKVASVFNIHFAKPLIMDYALELINNDDSDSYLFIETIYEHGEKSLNKLELGIDKIYNLMQQSADAIALLHDMDITHFDIKPTHMTYNDDTNILKVIDMENLYEYSKMSEMYKETTKLEDKIKSLRFTFYPPEVLKLKKGVLKSKEFIFENIGTIDVYCWAMSFYSLLLKKSQGEVNIDVDKLQLNNEEDYSKFLNEIETKLKSIKATQYEENQLKVIIEELMKALSYNPEKRPKMKDIIKRMNICKDCLDKDKKKVTLECKHFMCEKCILNYILEKFNKEEKYNHKVMCNICKEIKEISIINNYMK